MLIGQFQRANIRVMPRLNLTLDKDTSSRLSRHAKRAGSRTATVARELIREALGAREARTRMRKLAEDYRAGGRDAASLVDEFELPQLDLLDDEKS